MKKIENKEKELYEKGECKFGELKKPIDGDFTISNMSDNFPAILQKINCVRGINWECHLSGEEGKSFNSTQNDKTNTESMGLITIQDDGEFTIWNMSNNFPAILQKINFTRGNFWRNNLSDEDKKRFRIR